MKPARAPRDVRSGGRLLHVDVAHERVDDRRPLQLPELLRPGDVLVLNDAATLPASLELRLLGRQPDGSWRAVAFGPGDWRTPTEQRPAPPRLGAGTSLQLGELS